MTHKKSKSIFLTLLLTAFFFLFNVGATQGAIVMNLDKNFPANVYVGDNVVADGNVAAHNLSAARDATIQRNMTVHGSANIDQDLNVVGQTTVDSLDAVAVRAGALNASDIEVDAGLTATTIDSVDINSTHVNTDTITANTLQANTTSSDLLTINRFRQNIATTVTSSGVIYAPAIPVSEGYVIIQNTSTTNQISSFQLPGPEVREENNILELTCTADLPANITFSYSSQCRIVGHMYEDMITHQGIQNYFDISFGNTIRLRAIDSYYLGMAIAPGESTTWVVLN